MFGFHPYPLWWVLTALDLTKLPPQLGPALVRSSSWQFSICDCRIHDPRHSPLEGSINLDNTSVIALGFRWVNLWSWFRIWFDLISISRSKQAHSWKSRIEFITRKLCIYFVKWARGFVESMTLHSLNLILEEWVDFNHVKLRTRHLPSGEQPRVISGHGFDFDFNSQKCCECIDCWDLYLNFTLYALQVVIAESMTLDNLESELGMPRVNVNQREVRLLAPLHPPAYRLEFQQYHVSNHGSKLIELEALISQTNKHTHTFLAVSKMKVKGWIHDPRQPQFDIHRCSDSGFLNKLSHLVTPTSHHGVKLWSWFRLGGIGVLISKMDRQRFGFEVELYTLQFAVVESMTRKFFIYSAENRLNSASRRWFVILR